MDNDGKVLPGVEDPNFDEDHCLKMYTTMCRLQVFYMKFDNRIDLFAGDGSDIL